MVLGSQGWAWKCSLPPRTASMTSPTRPGPMVPVTRPTFPTTSSVMASSLSTVNARPYRAGPWEVTPGWAGTPRTAVPGLSARGDLHAGARSVAVDPNRGQARCPRLRDHLELDHFHARRRERHDRTKRRALAVAAERCHPVLRQAAGGERDRVARGPRDDETILVGARHRAGQVRPGPERQRDRGLAGRVRSIDCDGRLLCLLEVHRVARVGLRKLRRPRRGLCEGGARLLRLAGFHVHAAFVQVSPGQLADAFGIGGLGLYGGARGPDRLCERNRSVVEVLRVAGTDPERNQVVDAGIDLRDLVVDVGGARVVAARVQCRRVAAEQILVVGGES